MPSLRTTLSRFKSCSRFTFTRVTTFARSPSSPRSPISRRSTRRSSTRSVPRPRRAAARQPGDRVRHRARHPGRRGRRRHRGLRRAWWADAPRRGATRRRGAHQLLVPRGRSLVHRGDAVVPGPARGHRPADRFHFGARIGDDYIDPASSSAMPARHACTSFPTATRRHGDSGGPGAARLMGDARAPAGARPELAQPGPQPHPAAFQRVGKPW